MINVARQLTRKLSGKPVNCRNFVDLLDVNAKLSVPNTDSSVSTPLTVVGQRKIFQFCEFYLSERFVQTDAFVTGEIYIAGNFASFERTVIVMNDLNCRMVVRGIATFVVDDQYMVTHLTDVFDPIEMQQKLQGCSFPEPPASSPPPPSSPSPASVEASKADKKDNVIDIITEEDEL